MSSSRGARDDGAKHQSSAPMISNVRSNDLGTGRGTRRNATKNEGAGKQTAKKGRRQSSSALDREYGKRYGQLYKDVKDAFGSSEQNRDVAKLLDLLAEKIRRHQKQGTLVEAFRMFVHAGGSGSGSGSGVERGRTSRKQNHKSFFRGRPRRSMLGLVHRD